MRLRLPVRPARARADDQQSEADTRRTGLARVDAVLSRRVVLRVPVPGPAFAAVTVAPALLAVAWLVPGTGMLLAGRLRAVPMLIIFIPLAIALFHFAMGRLPAGWPRFNEAEPDATAAAARRKPDVS